MHADDCAKLSDAFTIDRDTLTIRCVFPQNVSPTNPSEVIVSRGDGKLQLLGWYALHPTYALAEHALRADVRLSLRWHVKELARYQAAATRLGIDPEEDGEDETNDLGDPIAATPTVEVVA